MPGTINSIKSESLATTCCRTMRDGATNCYHGLRDCVLGLWNYIGTCCSDGGLSGTCCNGRDNQQSRRPDIKSRKRKTSANAPTSKQAASSAQQVSPPTSQDMSVTTVNSTSGSSHAPGKTPMHISTPATPPTPSQLPPPTTTTAPMPTTATAAPTTTAPTTTAPTTITAAAPTTKTAHPHAAQVPHHVHSTAAKISTSHPPEPKAVITTAKEPEQHQQPAKESTPEPPRIDFVETGSIFGDRKRPGTDPNMFLLENGKFKSPGKPKIIQGPGGRSIRMTFQRGFPAHRSIESRSSLPSISAAKSAPKRSSDSFKTKTSVDGSQERFELLSKKVKSAKSAQSNQSLEGNENDTPGHQSPNNNGNTD